MRDRKKATRHVWGGVCVCFKESDNPPSLSLARYLGIRTARKWQTTVKEQVLLGLRCVTEQTLPHQTGCLFCTLPLSSVTYYPNHTESPSCHMVIWMKLIVSTGINGRCVRVCLRTGCVCPGWRQAGCSSHAPLSSLLLPFFSKSVISRRTHGELSWGSEGKGMRNH